MKSLILLPSQPSLHLSSSNSSPWNPKMPTFHPTTLPNQNRPKTTHKLHANPKGFGNAPPATAKETPSTKDPNKNGNKVEEEIPQVVFERMLVRIGVSVGLPMAVGFASLKAFDVIKERHLWDFPLWVPFLTTLVTFGTSALGIAYGSLSTSWDAEKKGSILGFEEAQSNWVEMWREEDENNNRNQ